MMNNDYDYELKLKVIGDEQAGKSCLILRYADDIYTESFISTIGVNFKVKTLEIDDKIVKTQVWDTKKNILNSHIAGSHATMAVIDVTDSQALAKLQALLANEAFQTPIITLVGTKCDADNRVVNSKEVDKFIEEYNKNFSPRRIAAYVETSAKTGENVQLAFEATAKATLNNLITNKKDPKVKKVAIEPIKVLMPEQKISKSNQPAPLSNPETTTNERMRSFFAAHPDEGQPSNRPKLTSTKGKKFNKDMKQAYDSEKAAKSETIATPPQKSSIATPEKPDPTNSKLEPPKLGRR